MNVLLSGQAVCRVFLPESGRSVFAKVTYPAPLSDAQGLMNLDLAVESRALSRVRLALPHAVPEPLGLVHRDGWQVLVTETVEHEIMTIADLERLDEVTYAGLLEYFHKGFTGFAGTPDGGQGHLRLLSSVCEQFSEFPCIATREPWLRAGGAALLERLAVVEQHGDFVPNNIGIRPTGPIFFDWEDFGRVSLPGLDLCTLLVSGLRLDPHRVAEFFQEHGNGRVQQLVTSVCHLYGLQREEFRYLLPLYLAVFLRLKQSRGPEIQRRLEDLLARLPE